MLAYRMPLSYTLLELMDLQEHDSLFLILIRIKWLKLSHAFFQIMRQDIQLLNLIFFCVWNKG